MKLYKKIAAIATAAVMTVGVFAASTLADNVDYYENWTSDSGNGPANGTTTGANGTVTFNSITNVGTGTFNVTWKSTNQSFCIVACAGWSTGNATRKIGYNLGVFSHTSGSTGSTRFELCGWTRNALTEYYVIQNWVNYVPGVSDSSYTKCGTYTSDGASYTSYYKAVNGANIDGNGPFKQVVSVRNGNAPIGSNQTITFPNHCNAWNSNSNTKLGTSWGWQAMCIEACGSSGSASGSVWQAS